MKVKKTKETILYESFCQNARYFEGMNQPYAIAVNGKILRSKEIDDLCKQYLKAMEEMRGEEMKGKKIKCPRCGSERIFLDGCRMYATLGNRQKYRCRDCGHGFREGQEAK